MNNVVLLVDDDSDDSELFGEALQEIAPAVNCFFAVNGQEAFTMLQKIGQPDIIFLDINMPVMNGWECLAKLKTTSGFQTIPVIMYSTASHQKDIELAAETGATSFLSKPHDYKNLKDILKQLLTHVEKGTLDTLGPVVN